MDSVAAGDGRSDMSSPLTRYYAESGTPPGTYLGSGVADLGLEVGSEVIESHLANLLGGLAHPVTGQRLGRAPQGGKLATVAGFDLTFSVPKSVSSMWALADEGTQAIILACHKAAIVDTISYAERSVFGSRSGVDGVVSEEVTGVVATAFTHWDSRDGDPQLHDHVVVLNRAKSVSDGKWRSLDSKALYKSIVTLSELHQGILMDHLTAALGVGWDTRQRRHSELVRWEIDGVSEQLMAEFSSRTQAIQEALDTMVAKYVEDHGHEPDEIQRGKLAQWATLQTRDAKQHRSLESMVRDWHARAEKHVETRGVWITSLRNRNDLPPLRHTDLTTEMLATAATFCTQTVAGKRATYGEKNLMNEAVRLLHGVRFASSTDRIAAAERIAELGIAQSIQLTPSEKQHTPGRWKRADGTSKLRPRNHLLFTSQTVLDAEDRLLAAGRTMSGPVVSMTTVARICDGPVGPEQVEISTEQALAVEAVSRSGRVCDVLVGPAGAGKTTAMAAVLAVWEAEHGAGSVVGLAPSAAAAEVLGDELGIGTENLSKWLHEHRLVPEKEAKRDEIANSIATSLNPAASVVTRRELLVSLSDDIKKWSPRSGQLFIVDEASLAGTLALDELVDAVSQAGAKVLLVGDWGQLSAVDAGGAFSLLARDIGSKVASLGEIRRFKESWEKRASLALRVGQEHIISEYEHHGRVNGGGREELLNQLYSAWKADVEAGKTSLMLAADGLTVAALNQRARADRVAAGQVVEDGLAIRGEGVAGVGDEVTTRQNTRRLSLGKGWVKNGDRWVVTATNADGSMVVSRLGSHGSVVLPADYVREHVELAYASTAHRAQGRTVDTAHAYISPRTVREVLYVSTTRGREGNQLYVDTEFEPDEDTAHKGMQPPRTPHDVLAGVLRHEGADVSAHSTQVRENYKYGSIEALAREYSTLASDATHERFADLLAVSLSTTFEAEAVLESESLPALEAAMREAEYRGLDISVAIPAVIAQGNFAGVNDTAAVLHKRLGDYTREHGTKHQATTDLACGLWVRPRIVSDPDMAQALAEREAAMLDRARILATEALASRQRWTRSLGECPTGPDAHEWLDAVATVAAYRDLHGIHDATPIGSPARSIADRMLQNRVKAAIFKAQLLSAEAAPPATVAEPDIAISL